jgi:hypothetical protein
VNHLKIKIPRKKNLDRQCCAVGFNYGVNGLKKRDGKGLGWIDLAQYYDIWLVVGEQCRECLSSA